MSHWPSSAGACAPFFACCPARHAAGLPLNSNVRPQNMTLADIAPVISLAALVVSLVTAWFTLFRRGTVKSTNPSFIAVRYDFVGKNLPQAKIFLRCLLYSTGKRGQVIEALFLRVREGDRKEDFAFWGYGDKDLVRGSGLYVPESGLATNHHFNPIQTGAGFLFSGGTYELELAAKLVGREAFVSLWHTSIQMPPEAFANSIQRDTAVFFSWSPQDGGYLPSVESRAGPIHALSSPSEA
jgi:hypothetical protein